MNFVKTQSSLILLSFLCVIYRIIIHHHRCNTINDKSAHLERIFLFKKRFPVSHERKKIPRLNKRFRSQFFLREREREILRKEIIKN